MEKCLLSIRTFFRPGQATPNRLLESVESFSIGADALVNLGMFDPQSNHFLELWHGLSWRIPKRLNTPKSGWSKLEPAKMWSAKNRVAGADDTYSVQHSSYWSTEWNLVYLAVWHQHYGPKKRCAQCCGPTSKSAQCAKCTQCWGPNKGPLPKAGAPSQILLIRWRMLPEIDRKMEK